MHNRIIWLVAAFSLIPAACSLVGTSSVDGSGDIVTESRTVGDFDSVLLAGEGTVVITAAAAPTLSIETDDNLMEFIETTVDSGRLELKTRDGTDIQPSRQITYQVGTTRLESLQLAGAGSFEVGTWESETFSVTLAGAGAITIESLTTGELDVTVAGTGAVSVAGTADTQDVTLAGIGDYLATDLRSQSAAVVLSGTGDVFVWVEDDLDIVLSGIGTVSYFGTPTVSQTTSGTGSIHGLGEK